MRLFACFLAALLCSGCFVLDELDQGEELMLQASSRGGKHLEEQKRKQEQEEQWSSAHEATHKDEGMLDGMQKTVAEWWDKATAEPPRERGPGDALVRCELGSKSRFMSKNDCDLRGGRAA